MRLSGPNSTYLRDELFSKTTVTVRHQDVWLDCMFENRVSINWYKGVLSRSATEITNSTRYCYWWRIIPQVYTMSAAHSFHVTTCRERTTVYNNGTLKISKVRWSDEDTYLCEGIGPDGISQSFTANLNIASK